MYRYLQNTIRCISLNIKYTVFVLYSIEYWLQMICKSLYSAFYLCFIQHPKCFGIRVVLIYKLFDFLKPIYIHLCISFLKQFESISNMQELFFLAFYIHTCFLLYTLMSNNIKQQKLLAYGISNQIWSLVFSGKV